MGKTQTPPTKADELRELTRRANEALKDLQAFTRTVEKLMASAWEERVSAYVASANETVKNLLDEFTQCMAVHSNKWQKAIENRWAHLATMAVAENEIIQLVAMHVLKDAGGTVETDTARYHLVKEEQEADGRVSFALPRALARKADDDPQVRQAVRDAVAEHEPDLELLAWSSQALKGSK